MCNRTLWVWFGSGRLQEIGRRLPVMAMIAHLKKKRKKIDTYRHSPEWILLPLYFPVCPFSNSMWVSWRSHLFANPVLARKTADGLVHTKYISPLLSLFLSLSFFLSLSLSLSFSVSEKKKRKISVQPPRLLIKTRFVSSTDLHDLTTITMICGWG